MGIEIKARIVKFEKIESGVSRTGSSWKKQQLIVNTFEERYPKDVALTLFGENIVGDAERYNVGDTLTFHLNLESKPYNGKWYNEINCWRISVAPGASSQPAQQRQAAPAQARSNAMPSASPPLDFFGQDDGGDLPF